MLYRKNIKLNKLYGGITGITKYGSTVKLDTTGDHVLPLVLHNNLILNKYFKPITQQEKLFFTDDDIEYVNNIAFNPLKYLTNNNIDIPFWKWLRTNKPEIYYDLHKYHREDMSLLKYLLNLGISENYINIYNDIVRYLINHVKELSVVSIISQGNITTKEGFHYRYNTSNGVEQFNNRELRRLNITKRNSTDEYKIIFSHSNFRNWYDKSEKVIYNNIIPTESAKQWKNSLNLNNNNQYITSDNGVDIDKIKQSTKIINLSGVIGPIWKNKVNNNITDLDIADIYPAKMSQMVAMFIYKYIEDKTIATRIVAMHILIVYLINIYGGYAQIKSYNSSVGERFYSE